MGRAVTLFTRTATNLTIEECTKKALLIGTLIEELLGKKLPEFDKADWGILQEAIGEARIIEREGRGCTISGESLAREIGTSKQALYQRGHDRKKTKL